MLEQGPRRPELRTRAWATPSAEVRDVQADVIPIDRDHDHRWIGEIVYLERDKGGNLWAVGHVRDDVLPIVHVGVGSETVAVETDLYWSASRIGTEEYEDIVIDSVALTASPARSAAQPVKFLPGALDHRHVAGKERWGCKGASTTS